jgi:plasmid maintenance system antidote protein VapI
MEERSIMTMKNPPHPGGIVLRQCSEPLGLSIKESASALGVTRNALSELVNGKRGVSPEQTFFSHQSWPLSFPRAFNHFQI